MSEPGKPIGREAVESAIHKFWKWVVPDPNSGCWLWLGSGTSGGYGQISIGPRRFYAHRYAYEYFVGPIPDGMTIDHLCRVTWCANPKHLEAVPIWENTKRGTSQAARNHFKTHCKRGHEFTPTNTHIRDDGSRQCRSCWKIHNDAAKARREAK